MKEPDLLRLMGQIGWQPTGRNRDWLDGHCPVARWTHPSHTDRHPSFGVATSSTGPSAFVCHACRHHGRIGRLFQLMAFHLRRDGAASEQIDRLVALARHADQADAAASVMVPWEQTTTVGLVHDPLPEALDEAVYAGLFPPVAAVPAALAYLATRRVRPETATWLGLLADPEQHRVLFEVRDRAGLLFGYTGRSWEPAAERKVKDYAGLAKRHLILGEHRWQAGRPLVVVEGLIDYVRVAQHLGERANVGAVLGSYLSAEKAERICALDESTYLFFDNDDAGRTGLFGQLDPVSGKRSLQDCAVARLQQHVPLLIARYPVGAADDPGAMRRRDVVAALRSATLWTPRSQQAARPTRPKRLGSTNGMGAGRPRRRSR